MKKRIFGVAAVMAALAAPALADTPATVDEFVEKHAVPAPSSNAEAEPADTPVNLSEQAAEEFEAKHAAPAPSSNPD